MPRKAATQELTQDTMDTDAVSNAGHALALQGAKAQALMQAYNVTSANPDALEMEIRGFQQTAVESLFAIGARLIVMKALCAHGEWAERLERINMAGSSARRIIQATLKFADPTKPRDKLAQLGRGKMIELLMLDDEQLDTLEDGGDVLELDLDEVSRMSTSELRKALRETRAKVDAKDKLLERRNKDVDKLQEQLDAPYTPSEGAVAQTQEEQAQFLALQEAHLEAIAAQSRLAVIVRDIKTGSSEPLAEEADAAMRHLCQRTAETVNEHGIAVDFEELITPSWLQAKKSKKA
jgi:hypothetical protein